MPSREKENSELQISEEDVWLLLISAFRYALGRETYMPTVITAIILKNKHLLTEWQRHQIATEVYEYRDTWGNIGASFDTELWLRFAAMMEEPE